MAGLFKLFVLQSQDAWGARNRLRTVWRLKPQGEFSATVGSS